MTGGTDSGNMDDLLAASEVASWERLVDTYPVSYRGRYVRQAHRAGFDAGLAFARIALGKEE